MENKDLKNNSIEKNLSVKIYDDALKPSISTLGEAVNGVMKLVALPFTFLGMTVNELSEKYETFISEVIDSVPKDKLVMPKAAIVSPLLDNVKFVFEEEELKNYYSKLLACSMNCDIASMIHPAYVEVLRQMSPLDARLFRDMFLLNDEVILEQFEWKYDRSLILLGIDSFNRLGLIIQEIRNETLERRIKLSNFGCVFKRICILDNGFVKDDELKLLIKERNNLYNFDANGKSISFGLKMVNTLTECEIYNYQRDITKENLPILVLTVLNNERADIVVDDIYIETQAKLNLTRKVMYKVNCDNFDFPCKIGALEYKNFIFKINTADRKDVLKSNKSVIKVITGTITYDMFVKDQLT